TGIIVQTLGQPGAQPGRCSRVVGEAHPAALLYLTLGKVSDMERLIVTVVATAQAQRMSCCGRPNSRRAFAVVARARSSRAMPRSSASRAPVRATRAG